METRPTIDLAAAVTFPKTGKRGVPQQFPRRLYEMLEMESARHEQQQQQQQLQQLQQLQRQQLSVAGIVTGGYGIAHTSLLLAPTAPAATDSPLISWSPTGRAFHILDSKLFAEQVLPSYFRTSKFSSFQRNLNLYGFSKVRRGPDIDMYAHPSFQRGKPENLFQLRKLTTAADRQRAAENLAEYVAAQQQQEAEVQQQPRAMYQGLVATDVIATATPPTYLPPRRSVSVTSTDYFSPSSFSAACFDASSTTSGDDSEENTANVTTAYNGISITDLIQTYQKSVDARSVSSSSSVASSSVEVAATISTTAATSAEHHSSEHISTSKTTAQHKRKHSADSLEDNKLALLALAMTSMAGQEIP